MIKQEFDKYKSMDIPHFKEMVDTDHVQMLINKLIDNLYKPDLNHLQFVADPAKLKEWFVEEESINWGSLCCGEVEKHGEKYFATVHECAPAACNQLCVYIEQHMLAWGWTVECKTEW